VRHMLRSLLEMIRFSHTLFALPFALLAAVMAYSLPREENLNTTFVIRQILGIVICMVGARSAAMAFNRIVDRHIDAKNPRTETRHLPSGQLSVFSVTLFTLASALIFIAGTLLFLPNPLPIILAVPVLIFLLGYSYTKRFTALAHFWLGLALMLAPLCTWIAIRGEAVMASPADVLPALVLGLAVMFWVAGFDIIYACQDIHTDRQANLHSVPARLGVGPALRLAAACHFGMLLMLGLLPSTNSQIPWGWLYWCALGVVTVLLFYEHWLVRPDDLTRINIAFFKVNAVLSLGLFVIGALDLLAGI